MSYNSEGNNVTGGASRSFLGESVKIKGKITSDELLTIEGEVNGDINSSKTLTIGKSGFVNGKINAEEVKIHGKAEGSISAAGKLEISSQGNFSGSLKSDKLIIADGAVFKGKVNLDD
jgi:cytoskeletal protein CcmA (bactofilin family)